MQNCTIYKRSCKVNQNKWLFLNVSKPSAKKCFQWFTSMYEFQFVNSNCQDQAILLSEQDLQFVKYFFQTLALETNSLQLWRLIQGFK